MYEFRPVSVIVLAVLLVLSTGMVGIAVADSPLSVADNSEITIENDSDTETEPEDAETGESFEVGDLDTPETVVVGEQVTVTATISNPNEFETNQSVEFRLDGDVVDRQTVTIDAEENRTVSITLDAEAMGVGSYIHGFLTTDRGELAVLEVIPFAEIEFDDQETDGESVVVDSVRLSEGGFVAIYDEDDDRISVSEYLDAGDHDEIEIELADELDDDADLTAGVYLTDDEEFDEDDSLDRPYVDVDGEPITDSATVTVPVEDDIEEDDSDVEDDDATDADDSESVEAVTPAVSFSDQESDGESVVVDTAVLPVDGYVAVYEDDELIGVSEYLNADEYEAIGVDLFDAPDGEFERDRLTENTTLTAVLHEETSGNETFDHLSNESLDGPIVDEDGNPISDEAIITVPTAETDDEDDESDVEEPEAEDDEAEDDEAEDDEADDDEVEDDEADDDVDESDAEDDSDDAGDEDESDDSDETDDADEEGSDETENDSEENSEVDSDTEDDDSDESDEDESSDDSDDAD